MNQRLGPLIFLALHLLLLSVQAGETPETLLIRQVLDNDKFGMRRGDADLSLSGFSEKLVVYDAQKNPNPQAWIIKHETLATFAVSIETDLASRRYDITRQVSSITVSGHKAIATTIDSGQVIDRDNGVTTPFSTKRFWIFQKTKNEWLAHTLVNAWHDSSTIAVATSVPNTDIAAVIEDERAAWENGSSSAILSLFDEQFTGYDAAQNQAPASWSILFQDAKELTTWLNKRLDSTSYTIKRQLLFAQIGSNGAEAIALTQEDLSTEYNRGPAKQNLKRQILWTLSKRTGNWKITNMVLNFGVPN